MESIDVDQLFSGVAQNLNNDLAKELKGNTNLKIGKKRKQQARRSLMVCAKNVQNR